MTLPIAAGFEIARLWLVKRRCFGKLHRATQAATLSRSQARL
jgi:hypothetical protein